MIWKFFVCAIALLGIVGCDDIEGDITPPFTFACKIKVSDNEGNSLLQTNKDKLREITATALEPKGNDVKVWVKYYEPADFLSIDILEWMDGLENAGNRVQDYVIELDSSNFLSEQAKDTIRVRYEFKDYRHHVLEAFFNDEEPVLLTNSTIGFEIIKAE